MESGSDLPGGGAGSLTSPGRGGILYCVIARGTTVLARFSCLVSYDRCGWFFIQSLGMPPVLGTLQRSVILFWQRQDLLPPSSALTTFILIGARPQPAQDDTDSGRIPLPLCLWRRGDCLGDCRCRVLPVFRYSNSFYDPDSAYDRGEAFRFLDSVLDKFLKQFEQRVHSAIAFAMNTEFSPVIAR